jgi:hypothetical protein
MKKRSTTCGDRSACGRDCLDSCRLALGVKGNFCGDGSAGAGCGTTIPNYALARHASQNVSHPEIYFRPEA